MSVKSCTFDTNVRKISGVVLMHVYRVEKIEVVLLIVSMKIVVLMSVDSCTYDTNSRENSSVVLMHVQRGKSTTLLNRFDKNTTKCCHKYNRCKYAGCNIAIYPYYTYNIFM